MNVNTCVYVCVGFGGVDLGSRGDMSSRVWANRISYETIDSTDTDIK